MRSGSRPLRSTEAKQPWKPSREATSLGRLLNMLLLKPPMYSSPARPKRGTLAALQPFWPFEGGEKGWGSPSFGHGRESWRRERPSAGVSLGVGRHKPLINYLSIDAVHLSSVFCVLCIYLSL